MNAVQELSLRIAVYAELLKRIEQADADARRTWMQTMESVGADRAPACLPDGTKVSSVAITAGRTTPKVINPDAFLAHVKATRPDEVVEVVRPSYQKALLDQVAKTGEAVPGVEFRESAPYVRATPVKNSAGAIARAWADGELAFLDLLALPAPAESGEPPGPADLPPTV